MSHPPAPDATSTPTVAVKPPWWKNPWFLTIAAAVVVIAIASVATKGDDSSLDVKESDGATGADVRHLTVDEYGAKWPLTVDSADVHCRDAAGAGYGSVTVTINGTEYAVNGTARQGGQWPDFAESGYWKKDPEFRGLKVDISPIIDAGLALC